MAKIFFLAFFTILQVKRLFSSRLVRNQINNNFSIAFRHCELELILIFSIKDSMPRKLKIIIMWVKAILLIIDLLHICHMLPHRTIPHHALRSSTPTTPTSIHFIISPFPIQILISLFGISDLNSFKEYSWFFQIIPNELLLVLTI